MANYLSAEEVLPFLHGCCGTFELEGCTGFSRFTQEQLSYYSERSSMDFVRSHVPAGIYLDCITDTPEISFTYRLYNAKGTYVIGSGFDIWENDVFGANFRIDPQVTDPVTITYTRRKKEPSRIRIYFTGGSVVLPDRFCLGNALPVENHGKQILFYGDSITQSAYIPTPSLSWFLPIAMHMEAEYLNRGIGSMVFAPESLPSETDCKPDTIFIEYGCNDITLIPDNETCIEKAAAWMQKLCALYPDAKKFCILPDFIPQEGVNAEYWQRLPLYCADLAALCADYAIPAIAGKDLIPALPTLFCGDHIHFNEAGSAIFANRLLYSIKKFRGSTSLQ